MSTISLLLDEIEAVRMRLELELEKSGFTVTDEVLALSQSLDRLLTTHARNMKSKERLEVTR